MNFNLFLGSFSSFFSVSSAIFTVSHRARRRTKRKKENRLDPLTPAVLCVAAAAADSSNAQNATALFAPPTVLLFFFLSTRVPCLFLTKYGCHFPRVYRHNIKEKPLFLPFSYFEFALVIRARFPTFTFFSRRGFVCSIFSLPFPFFSFLFCPRGNSNACMGERRSVVLRWLFFGGGVGVVAKSGDFSQNDTFLGLLNPTKLWQIYLSTIVSY